jgi:aryl-alcohol dehydrogenase-like predicted oxidoreductase
MNYRTYKDMHLSEIGLGCYGLSGAYGPKDLTAYKQTIQRAFHLGVNFFDTAEAYGEAEGFLGKTIKPFRQQIYIATKVGVREGFKPNLSPGYIQSACEDSLKALQTDYIDLYQIHFDDPDTLVSETVNALEALVNQEKIRHSGLGHLPRGKINAYIKLGKPFSVLLELSAVARSAIDELLPACQQNDIGAIAFSVTGRGLLTGKINADTTFAAGDIRNLDPLFQRERIHSALRVQNQLSQIGEKYNKTSSQVAIAWVLSQPGVICALTGPSKVSHLEENLAGSGWQLDSQDQHAFNTFLEQENERLINEQKATLKQLINVEITADPQKAFKDLIYAVETALELHLTSEKQIMPVFIDLYSLKEHLDSQAVTNLEKIRTQIADLIN